MSLSLFTFTGADNSTSPSQLAALSRRFPFIEWGILFSAAAEGKHRYPTKAWRDELLEKHSALPLCAHLCAKSLKLFAQNDASLLAEVSRFARIQLNFHAPRLGSKILGALEDRTREALSRGQQIIVQLNPANESFLAPFAKLGASALFDASGGRGETPSSWSSPPSGFARVGYAGGLSPENINAQLSAIQSASSGFDCWADMESGLRNPADQSFSFERARVCAEAFSALRLKSGLALC